MERELWLALYKVARECDPAGWWVTTKFFRLGDRERLSVGGASRSSDALGVRARELAQRLVVGEVAFASNNEPPTPKRGSTEAVSDHGRSFSCR